MENFTEEEIRQIESREDLQDMINILDSVLDGEVFHIRNTDTDITTNDDLKPVLPRGIISSDEESPLKNKKMYAYVLQIFISLLIDLNPIKTETEEDYIFRLAIIVNIVVSGCISENKNWLYSNIQFDKNYIKEKGDEMFNKNKKTVLAVQNQLSSAYNFIAFSCMNMVRFNHHFPNDKLNLISKSLNNLPDAQKNRILDEEDLNTFYDVFVTAARILHDKKFYERYILKKKDETNKYFYYKVLGSYNIEYEEEIIKVRSENTPNGFLILDIINEIYQDLINRHILFLIPYKKQIGELLQIRRYLRSNPFAYHPSKGFYKCKAKDYDKVVDKFQNLMKHVGSFIFQYSEEMYDSVRSAKCRKKYEKSLKRDDEVLIKAINEILGGKVQVNEKTKSIIQSKLNVMNVEINEETDLEQENNKYKAEIAALIEKELVF